MTAPAAPLAGITVLELGNLLAAPCAGMVLADLGADVIKVEAPGGDPARELQSAAFTGSGTSPTFLAFNRNKRSIAVDLGAQAGREVVCRIAAIADVVLESFRPGAAARLQVDAASLREVNPSLVYASLCGFGDHGPQSTRRGVDLVIQAESGIMAVTGEAGGPPLKVGFTVVDVAAGHVMAQAVLAALFARTRSGQGDTIAISLVDVALHLQAAPMTEYLATGVVPPRCGNAAPMTAPADMFRTRDGHVVISAYLERHWQLLCEAIGRPDLVSDARFAGKADRVRNRAALVVELETALAAARSEEWVSRLQAVGLVVGVVKTYADIETDPQVAAMGTIVTVGGERTYRTVRTPALYGSWRADHAHGAPGIGAHTDAVLAELGYSAAEVATLRAAGAVTGTAVTPAPVRDG